MKQKILDILNKHKWQPVNTYLTSDVITEEEFEAVAEDIDKLLATPAVSESLKCDCKHSGSCRYEIVIAESKELCRHKE
jgi:hypothetical protein